MSALFSPKGFVKFPPLVWDESAVVYMPKPVLSAEGGDYGGEDDGDDDIPF